jgi:hypothetical protein
VQRQPVAHTQLAATVPGDPTVRCRAARAYSADLLIASHYSVERPDSSVLRGACEQRGRATRRDDYRSVEDIISYSYTVAPYDLRGLPALGPPVGPWGLTVTARP